MVYTSLSLGFLICKMGQQYFLYRVFQGLNEMMCEELGIGRYLRLVSFFHFGDTVCHTQL